MPAVQDHEVLVSRLIDRPIRPMIQPGWTHSTQARPAAAALAVLAVLCAAAAWPCSLPPPSRCHCPLPLPLLCGALCACSRTRLPPICRRRQINTFPTPPGAARAGAYMGAELRWAALPRAAGHHRCGRSPGRVWCAGRGQCWQPALPPDLCCQPGWQQRQLWCACLHPGLRAAPPIREPLLLAGPSSCTLPPLPPPPARRGAAAQGCGGRARGPAARPRLCCQPHCGGAGGGCRGASADAPAPALLPAAGHWRACAVTVQGLRVPCTCHCVTSPWMRGSSCPDAGCVSYKHCCFHFLAICLVRRAAGRVHPGPGYASLATILIRLFVVCSSPCAALQDASTLDLVIAGTSEAVLMIEGFCDFLTEEQMLEVGAAAQRLVIY